MHATLIYWNVQTSWVVQLKALWKLFSVLLEKFREKTQGPLSEFETEKKLVGRKYFSLNHYIEELCLFPSPFSRAGYQSFFLPDTYGHEKPPNSRFLSLSIAGLSWTLTIQSAKWLSFASITAEPNLRHHCRKHSLSRFLTARRFRFRWRSLQRSAPWCHRLWGSLKGKGFPTPPWWARAYGCLLHWQK